MSDAPDYRFFDLRGSHAQIGDALGRADPPFRMQPWWAPPPSARFAANCAAVVRDVHPHLLDEYAAYAAAQRLDAEALWRQCCRVNLKARVRGVTSAEGCSTFVWRASEAHTLAGRNYDYWPMQIRRQRIRFTPDCCALPALGSRGSVPGGRYDGLNSAGLFVSLHVVMTDTPDEDDVRPGAPFHLVARLALELCHSARDARDLLTRIPHISSLNYLLADAREAFVIEADPRRVRVLEAQGAVLAVTNHFRHPEMQPLHGRRAISQSTCRLNFLERHAATGNPATAEALLAHAERVMADRSAPLCGQSGALTTLWSCVAELGTRRIRYAAGPPDVTPFEAFLVA